MGFVGFVVLLVVAVVVALVLTKANISKLKIALPGGITEAIIVSYIGARLGAVLFGNWPILVFQGISVLPAILGAVVVILLAKECCKKQ